MTERVLVTGAASGLGRAIASRYVAAGSTVLFTDVDEAGLAEIPDSAHVRTRRLDVTDDGSWADAIAWAEREWGGLDLLVNNAGVAAGGRLEYIPMADWDWILELNLKSAVRGCRTVVPLFKRQQAGYIVNVASLAGLANLPSMSSYNVTKAGVIALSRTLRYELAPDGIGVSVVTPAFVRTNLAASLRAPDPGAQGLAQQAIDGARMTPDQVAEKVHAGVAKRRFLIQTHARGRVLDAANRLAPAAVEKLVVRRWTATQRQRFTPAAPAQEG